MLWTSILEALGIILEVLGITLAPLGDHIGDLGLSGVRLNLNGFRDPPWDHPWERAPGGWVVNGLIPGCS